MNKPSVHTVLMIAAVILIIGTICVSFAPPFETLTPTTVTENALHPTELGYQAETLFGILTLIVVVLLILSVSRFAKRLRLDG